MRSRQAVCSGVLAAPARPSLWPALVGLGVGLGAGLGFVPLGWGRIALVVAGLWLALLLLALVLAQRFRQPIVRITVKGATGDPGRVIVRGWWISPGLPEIETFVAGLGLPLGSEIWARKAGDQVEVRSNLRIAKPIEAAIQDFLATPSDPGSTPQSESR